MPNHYSDPISQTSGRVGGLSRKAGDASSETKMAVISKIISYGKGYGLSDKDIANLIAFAKIESGYNPDAAAQGSWTSALGVFQITDTTALDAAKRLTKTIYGSNTSATTCKSASWARPIKSRSRTGT